MDNNEIKKALECCNTIGGCKVCPYSCYGKPTDNGECGEKMSLDALALINSQEQRIKELTEENERLRAENKALVNEFKSAPLGRFEFEILYKEKCTQLDVANRRVVELLADKEFSKINRTEYKKMVVSKMQTEIEARCVKGGIYPAFVKRTIDQIAKEMLEGEK